MSAITKTQLTMIGLLSGLCTIAASPVLAAPARVDYARAKPQAAHATTGGRIPLSVTAHYSTEPGAEVVIAIFDQAGRRVAHATIAAPQNTATKTSPKLIAEARAVLRARGRLRLRVHTTIGSFATGPSRATDTTITVRKATPEATGQEANQSFGPGRSS